MSGGAGRKLLDTGRKLPAIAADIQLTMRTLVHFEIRTKILR